MAAGPGTLGSRVRSCRRTVALGLERAIMINYMCYTCRFVSSECTKNDRRNTNNEPLRALKPEQVHDTHALR